jgi:hypothetical protein
LTVLWSPDVDPTDVAERYAAIVERELAAAQALSDTRDSELYLYEKGGVLGVGSLPPDNDLWRSFRWRYLATVLPSGRPMEGALDNCSPAATELAG